MIQYIAVYNFNIRSNTVLYSLRHYLLIYARE